MIKNAHLAMHLAKLSLTKVAGGRAGGRAEAAARPGRRRHGMLRFQQRRGPVQVHHRGGGF